MQTVEVVLTDQEINYFRKNTTRCNTCSHLDVLHNKQPWKQRIGGGFPDVVRIVTTCPIEDCSCTMVKTVE